MNVSTAVRQGFARTAAAPRLVFALWFLWVLAALPAAWLMKDALAESIGPSLFGRALEEGFDFDWYEEFAVERGGGLASTFTPSAVVGAGAAWDNLELWWSGRLFTEYRGVVMLGLAWAVAWALLLGGVLAVLAGGEGRPRGLAQFFAAGGRTFGRFLQLALLSGVLYYLIYRLARALFGWLEGATQDVTAERTVLYGVLAIAGLVVVLLHLVRLVFDYAKIAVATADGEIHVFQALSRALAFALSRPGRVIGVYTVVGLLTLLVIGVYSFTAPGVAQSGALTVVLAFCFSQLYLVLRLGLRLVLLGAELGLYTASS